MKISTIANELNSLAYHGRGIMIGKSADAKKAVTAYFIMRIYTRGKRACQKNYNYAGQRYTS